MVGWILILSTTLNFSILGFSATGWGWVLPLVYSIFVLFISKNKINFPLLFWIPWFIVVILGLFRPHIFSFQSSLQILTPLLFGLAVSKQRFFLNWKEVFEFFDFIFIIWLLTIPFVKLQQLILGIIPSITGLAVEGITSLLFQSYYLVLFIYSKEKKHLFFYLLALSIPLLAVTRGPIIAGIGILILTIANLGIFKRLILLFSSVLIGLFLFHSERFQMKSFHRTGVSLEEALNNPDMVQTTGRKYMWELLEATIQEGQYWIGAGSNAQIDRAIALGYSSNYLAHNDWLRIRIDYGMIGMIVFLLTVVFFILKVRKDFKYHYPHLQILAYGAATAFVPFLLVMNTDNVLIYAHSFGNLQFLLLGLSYSAKNEIYNSLIE
ncbi:O-antigen ligase family protein [Algoriphagus kandeliae]|nr:O-antigen ligase family protein [Algoriphagus kandeliae]